jgi:hypothetical protein
LALVSKEFKAEILALAYELDEELRNDPDYLLEQEFNEALKTLVDEQESGDSGDSAIGSPPEQKTLGEDPEEVDYVCEFSLVDLAKKILDTDTPEENELKSLNRRLSQVVRTRLNLKVIQKHGRKRFVQVSWAYYRRVTTVTKVTKPKRKVVVLQPGRGFAAIHNRSRMARIGQRYMPGPYVTFLLRLEHRIKYLQSRRDK